MTTKDKVVFALYIASSTAIVAHAGVEIWKTFKKDKPVLAPVTEIKKNA